MAQVPWFRLYTEARTDKKLGKLSLAERGVWINLLCYAAEQDERGTFSIADREKLALECADEDVEILDATLAKLERWKVIEPHDDDPGAFIFRNFAKRQYEQARYPSAQPEAVRKRVSDHRAKVKAEQAEAESNDPVTSVTSSNDPVTSVTSSNDPVTSGNACNAYIQRRGETDTEPEGYSPPNSESDGVVSLPQRLLQRGAETLITTTSAGEPLREFATRVAQAAGIRPPYNKANLINILRIYVVTFSPERILGEAATAAEWIADPTRNKTRKRMDPTYLAHWLKRELREHQDHQQQQAATITRQGESEPQNGQHTNGVGTADKVADKRANDTRRMLERQRALADVELHLASEDAPA